MQKIRNIFIIMVYLLFFKSYLSKCPKIPQLNSPSDIINSFLKNSFTFMTKSNEGRKFNLLNFVEKNGGYILIFEKMQFKPYFLKSYLGILIFQNFLGLDSDKFRITKYLESSDMEDLKKIFELGIEDITYKYDCKNLRRNFLLKFVRNINEIARENILIPPEIKEETMISKKTENNSEFNFETQNDNTKIHDKNNIHKNTNSSKKTQDSIIQTNKMISSNIINVTNINKNSNFNIKNIDITTKNNTNIVNKTENNIISQVNNVVIHKDIDLSDLKLKNNETIEEQILRKMKSKISENNEEKKLEDINKKKLEIEKIEKSRIEIKISEDKKRMEDLEKLKIMQQSEKIKVLELEKMERERKKKEIEKEMELKKQLSIEKENKEKLENLKKQIAEQEEIKKEKAHLEQLLKEKSTLELENKKKIELEKLEEEKHHLLLLKQQKEQQEKLLKKKELLLQKEKEQKENLLRKSEELKILQLKKKLKEKQISLEKQKMLQIEINKQNEQKLMLAKKLNLLNNMNGNNFDLMKFLQNSNKIQNFKSQTNLTSLTSISSITGDDDDKKSTMVRPTEYLYNIQYGENVKPVTLGHN